MLHWSGPDAAVSRKREGVGGGGRGGDRHDLRQPPFQAELPATNCDDPQPAKSTSSVRQLPLDPAVGEGRHSSRTPTAALVPVTSHLI